VKPNRGITKQLKQPNFLYLHGFASGPGSTKAQYFLAQFQELGIQLHIPDLNLPSFTDMTLSSRLELISEVITTLPEGPVIIWGSSLGGLLALLYAKQNQEKVAGLVLLAPALEFSQRWEQMLGKGGLEKWASNGYISVQHYAYKKEKPLAYNFFLDAAKHETSDLKFQIPIMIFHGVDDVTVPIEVSRKFTQNNIDNVQLLELGDGHELIDSMPVIWTNARSFMNAWLN
jgi:pimeloyl-ACP methyl ester carboxylesterase